MPLLWGKAYEMLWQWKYGQQEQGTGDVVAVGTRQRTCCCSGSKIQEMLLLWEQGNGNMASGSKVQEMLLLWEQGIRDVNAMETWPAGTR
jgi:hypothetical protein